MQRIYSKIQKQFLKKQSKQAGLHWRIILVRKQDQDILKLSLKFMTVKARNVKNAQIQ